MKIYTKDEKIIAVETTFHSADLSITMKCLTNCTVSADCTDSEEILASILPRYIQFTTDFFGSQEFVLLTISDSEEITIA